MTSSPKLAASDAEKIVRHNKVPDAVVLIGIRGYWKRTMGDPTKNDRGIWDDAIALISPTAFCAWRANTDPSIYRPGIATLCEGVHPYRKGKHGISKGPGRAYPALRPATAGERLLVTRDGQTGTKYGVAINIHRGSINSTSSEGCQTIHPEHYDAAMKMIYSEMDRYGQKVIPYILTSSL